MFNRSGKAVDGIRDVWNRLKRKLYFVITHNEESTGSKSEGGIKQRCVVSLDDCSQT